MSISPERDRIVIGRIVGAHGIKGAIRIHPLTDFPDRFLEMQHLYIEKTGKPGQTLDVLEISSHEGKGQYLATVRGIDNREDAETLRGYVVTVSADERVTLPEGEYWIDSLIGLNIVDAESGEHLGKVEDVLSTGSNDIYQFRMPDGTLKLIPAIADVVREIDLDSACIRIVAMEGLLD